MTILVAKPTLEVGKFHEVYDNAKHK